MVSFDIQKDGAIEIKKIDNQANGIKSSKVMSDLLMSMYYFGYKAKISSIQKIPS